MGKTTKGNRGKAITATKKSRSSSTGVGGPQKILDSVFFLGQNSGNPNVPRARVLAISGIKSNTFPVTLSGMKKKGWIKYDKDTISLTQKGRTRANPLTSVSTDNISAQEDIKKRFKLGGKAALLFEKLVDGHAHDRESVVGSLGFKSKNSAAVMLSNLKKSGIIEYNKTSIHLSDLCFPYGRPGKT